MRSLKHAVTVTLSCAIAMSTYANSSSTFHVRAPFYNVPMQPAEDLYVDYSLDTDKIAMRCKITSGDLSADIRWQYMGTHYKAQLPLTLKASGTMQAQVTDNIGTIIISTPAVYSDGLTVTCEYIDK